MEGSLWITRQIKRTMRKRERLFKLARSSKHALHWQSYKKYHNNYFVQRQIHLAHSNYCMSMKLLVALLRMVMVKPSGTT